MPELPLRSHHEDRGARFRAEAGWSVPASYGPLDVEVRAARARAGTIDLSDRSKIELTGTERVPFLDGVVTADLKVLSPGASAYALLLNEKSRVLGDLRIYPFEHSLVLDVEASQREGILAILDKARISDDVEFRDLGAGGHLEVVGPASSEAVAGLLGDGLQGLPRDGFAAISADSGASEINVARTCSLGMDGYALWSVGSDLSELWDRLTAAAAQPIGRDAWEVLRIEGGVRRFGADMGPETLALESAPRDAISFTKGCYVGQEVVARGTYVGQIRRKLHGLQADGDLPPRPRDRVTSAGREVGTVTSGTWSPTLKAAIALAILRDDAVSQEHQLFIDRGGTNVRARLRALPFVSDAA